MPHSTLKLAVPIVAGGGLALVLGACATANTPQQNLAYDRWARCQAPYTQLERVDLDGRITFLSSNSATREAVVRCLVDAGGAGPRLPDPVATRPAGGP
jgi:hypothetical protein